MLSVAGLQPPLCAFNMFSFYKMGFVGLYHDIMISSRFLANKFYIHKNRVPVIDLLQNTPAICYFRVICRMNHEVLLP
jgi:hypothetical protein